MTTYLKYASLALAVGLFGCSEQPTPSADEASTDKLSTSTLETVNIDKVRSHIKTLASDEFLGRGPLTEGETLTINYLADEYKKLGLTGSFNGNFLQPVTMAKLTPDQNMTLKVGELSFNAGSDFTARTQQINPEINIAGSDVVFVGYGINAPEYNWDDFADIDVKDKTVIVLVNDPGFATQDDTLFTGNAMTYYGRWTYKYEEGARQGAKAVFIVHETAPAAYPWGVVESSNTGSKYTLIDQDNNASDIPVMGWIDEQAANEIFAQAGFDYQTEKANALKADFKPLDLKVKAELTLKSDISQAQSHNVVATLEGSETPDEYIVIGAHWDHFGTKQTEEGLKIYNGAVDNASGTAATIEIARILSEMHKKKPFKRSIIFANFTAEETGLIGSEQFATGEIAPTKQMVALLNIDGMNVLDGVDYILQYGKGMSEMEDYLAEAAQSQGRHVKMDPRPQNGLFFRSDHFSLAKQGVPSLLFMSLGDTDPDYIAHKYHKEADDYSPQWSMGGVKQDIELIVNIAAKLADNGDWPKWKAESDFKARRLQDR